LTAESAEVAEIYEILCGLSGLGGKNKAATPKRETTTATKGKLAMFTDARSKSVLFVAHCILNQNSISDGTATYPASVKEIVELAGASRVGLVQMPCPELMCLGLDRGNADGSAYPVVEENTRIRKAMRRRPAIAKLRPLVRQIVFQIGEYRKYGFDVRGIVGINRSPSCGVDTTSDNNQEVEGEGVFVEALRRELEKNGLTVAMVGIKAFEPEKAVATIRTLLNMNS
jgi:predicted secreted protein